MTMYDLAAVGGTEKPVYRPENYIPVHLDTEDRLPPVPPWADRVPGVLGGTSVAHVVNDSTLRHPEDHQGNSF